jgi:regulator of replication initiation timing
VNCRQFFGIIAQGSSFTVSDTFSNDLSGSLNCFAGSLQTQLDELLQEKARIKLRMRNLRHRLGVLRASSKKKERAARAGSHLRSIAIRRAQARPTCDLHEELARACRIAFLELGQSATAEQLLAAILRRGSFSFNAIENNPLVSINHLLISMAQRGEAISSNEGTQSRWAYRPKSQCFQ